MARAPATPFQTFDNINEAKANRPAPQQKKDGTEALPLNLYRLVLPEVNGVENKEVFAFSRSPVLAIGQTMQHYNLIDCTLAEPSARTPVPPAVRAKRAFEALDDAQRETLLAELMGSVPSNGESPGGGKKSKKH